MYVTRPEENYCSCLGWKYQSVPVSERTCKHLNNKKKEQRQYQRVRVPELMLLTKDMRYPRSGWYMSEKLDGVRGHWTGSQMVTRNGVVVDIPDRIRDILPSDTKLDGELWAQNTPLHVIVKKIQLREEDWDDDIDFYAFDIAYSHLTFDHVYAELLNMLGEEHVIPQTKLDNVAHIEDYVMQIHEKGGEGLVLRDPKGKYTVGRSRSVVKVKPVLESTAVYVGDGVFREMVDDGPTFKMKREDIDVGSVVDFRYCGRTSTGKPEHPQISR